MRDTDKNKQNKYYLIYVENRGTEYGIKFNT